MNRCPYCNHEAATVFEEVAHMEAAHPEVIEARLAAAGLNRFEGLPIIGHERALLNRLVRALQKGHATRGPYETRRGSQFEILVPAAEPRERDRIYRVEVTLNPQDAAR